MVANPAQSMIGHVVTSRAGRDRGDRYVVIAALGEDMVLVADGEKRAVDRPKKKNVKHLIVHSAAPSLAEQLAAGQPVRDEEIRQALAQAAAAERPPGVAAAGTGD